MKTTNHRVYNGTIEHAIAHATLTYVDHDDVSTTLSDLGSYALAHIYQDRLTRAREALANIAEIMPLDRATYIVRNCRQLWI